MNLAFQHVSGEQKHSRAISVCAYMSDKFSEDKHLKPFSEFVAKGQEGYDILVFREPGMIVPTGPTTRVFDVTSSQQGYARHLWRYLGGELGYDWTWFRGMDTPEVPAREQRLERATLECRNDALIWQRPGFACMGKFGATPRACSNLAEFLRFLPDNIQHNDWNVDEIILSRWISNGSVRVSLAMDGPLANKPWQLEWILQRLMRGAHTAIFKDRDDR